MQKEDRDRQRFVKSSVSDIWRELLGNSSTQVETTAPESETTLPTLKSDPWGELVQARGVEIIDLHQLHLHISDQDVEKALQIIQEQPLQDTSGDQNSGL